MVFLFVVFGRCRPASDGNSWWRVGHHGFCALSEFDVLFIVLDKKRKLFVFVLVVVVVRFFFPA